MKGIFSILAFTGVSMAHNVVTHFHINGVANPDCVRQAVSTNPLVDLSSDDMACNAVKGNGASKCVIKPSDVIAFEWRVDPNIPAAQYPLKDGTIPVGVTDDSHKGPCAVYMKKVDDSSTAVGAGDGWFKVSHDGLDQSGTFCTDRLRVPSLPQPGVVPPDIAPGDYLIRPEFLTLNNAGPVPNPPVYDSNGVQEGGQPQFYTACIQVTVEGTSGTASPSTVSIPGYVNINSPGLLFDIWNTPNDVFSNYPMPGPTPLLPYGTPGTIAGKADTVPSAVSSVVSSTTVSSTTASSTAVPSTAASATEVATSATSATSSGTTAGAPNPTTSVANSSPTDSGDTTPTSIYAVPTYVGSTDAPQDSTTAAQSPVPTHYSNIKYVTATTLITRTSTVRPHSHSATGSPTESGSDGSEPNSTGDFSPHSTHHHGYYAARHYGPHHRRGN